MAASHTLMNLMIFLAMSPPSSGAPLLSGIGDEGLAVLQLSLVVSVAIVSPRFSRSIQAFYPEPRPLRAHPAALVP